MYELIGGYITDCIKEHDLENAVKYLSGIKNIEEDFIALDGEEFYIEEIELN